MCAESVLELAKSRLQLAAQKGCDAVEPDNVDGYTNETGFELSQADQIQFNRDIAGAAHKQGLAVGLKNTFNLIGTLAHQLRLAPLTTIMPRDSHHDKTVHITKQQHTPCQQSRGLIET